MDVDAHRTFALAADKCVGKVSGYEHPLMDELYP